MNFAKRLGEHSLFFAAWMMLIQVVGSERMMAWAEEMVTATTNERVDGLERQISDLERAQRESVEDIRDLIIQTLSTRSEAPRPEPATVESAEPADSE